MLINMMEAEDVCTLHVGDDIEKKNSFLVNFSNGQLLLSETLPQFTLYNKSKDRTKRKRVLVAETDHLAYIGTNYDPKSAGISNSCQYCIGALDRETGIMTLHRTEVVTLHPHIPGRTDIEEGMEDETPTSEKMNKMVNLFGSEKQKRAFLAAQKNRQESGISDSAIDSAFSHAQEEVDMMSSMDTSMQNSGIIPQHNPAAQTPQDVYDINDIITLAELRVLKQTSEVFTEATQSSIAEWGAKNIYPQYVLQHIPSLPSTEPLRSLKAAMLLYAGFLIQIHDMTSKDVQRIGLEFGCTDPPPKVLNYLREKFTEKLPPDWKERRVRYSLSPRMKDKVLLYLLVLCLFIDDFTVDFSVLQKDLKCSYYKLREHFRALGCMVKKEKMKRKTSDDPDDPAFKFSGILTIPLRFPKPSQSKRKKKEE